MPSPTTREILILLIRKALPWVFLLAALYQIRLTASALTGKDSMVELWIMWMSNAKVTRLSAFVFGLAGVAYGLSQRTLRRAVEKRMEERIAELEKRPQ
jgi:hypothetical protein